MNTIQKQRAQDIDVLTLTQPSHKEFFYTVMPPKEEAAADAFMRFASVVRESGAQLLSLEVFGGPGSGALQREVVRNAFGDAAFPVTWVEEKSGPATRITGIQAWGIAGIPVFPILFNGRVLGAHFDAPALRYCRLGGITPDDTTLTPKEQTAAVFQRMDEALHLCNMRFDQVMRTWFFNHKLLDWYDDFNAARDAFFQEKQICQRMVPASTGIEGANPAGAALEVGALAVVPANDAVEVCAVPSPLQCAALEYGSTFSRAAEIREPGVHRLYISGTASISPDGKTQFDGDTPAQLKRTMEVVVSILRSRGMDLSNATRAITYFKHAEDIPLFEAWRTKAGIPAFPVVLVHNDVCRHDLLFEIELDAIDTSEQ